MIYFDCAASHPLRASTLELLQKTFLEGFASPSASHRLGLDLADAIEKKRRSFLKMVERVNEDQLVFTSSATESNNQLIHSLLNKEGIFIVSEAEHPSLVQPLLAHLSKERVIILRHKKNGEVDELHLAELLEGEVAGIFLSTINNHSGVILNLPLVVDLLLKISEKRRPHLHLDAVQGFLKSPYALDSKVISSITLSSHKVGGPKGVAALIVKKGIKLKPLFWGGPQEGGVRASTQNYPLIEAFFHGAELYEKQVKMHEVFRSDIAELRTYLKERIPAIIFPFEESATPYILTFIIPKISSDILLRHLEEKEIYLSSSSACSSKKKGPNEVFTALLIPSSLHSNVLRASFSPWTTKDELFSFANCLIKVYDGLSFLVKK